MYTPTRADTRVRERAQRRSGLSGDDGGGKEDDGYGKGALPKCQVLSQVLPVH